MYLNVYQPRLQHVNGAVWFFRGHRGATFASSALMVPITKDFVASIHRFCRDTGARWSTSPVGGARTTLRMTTWLSSRRPAAPRGCCSSVGRRRRPRCFAPRSAATRSPALPIRGSGRALRTETTNNDSRDFNIGERLCNLAALAQVGFPANRRLLDVERLTTDPTIGEAAFRAVADPVVVGSQRASALPFDSTRTQALLTALIVFRLLPHGFRNSDLRTHLASLLGGRLLEGRCPGPGRR